MLERFDLVDMSTVVLSVASTNMSFFRTILFGQSTSTRSGATVPSFDKSTPVSMAPKSKALASTEFFDTKNLETKITKAIYDNFKCFSAHQKVVQKNADGRTLREQIRHVFAEFANSKKKRHRQELLGC